jgi:hypothetical protein
MSKVNSTNFGGPSGSTPIGQNGAGSEGLDKFMPAADTRVAAGKRALPAPKRQTLQHNHQAQRGNGPVKTGYVRTPVGSAVAPMLQPSPRSSVSKPQQAATQTPARNPYNVNVTGVFERGPTSTNFGKKITVSKSFAMKNDSKLNTAIFVQGNSGTSVTAGQVKQTSSTTIGASAELERKFSTSNPNTSITAKAKVAGELNNSPTRTTAKAELGVTVRADQKIDKTTSAYVTVGGKTVISSVSTPTTTLAAELGLNKVISADGKLNGSLFGGVEQTLGANAVPYVGMKAAYKLDPTTSVLGEIKVKKDSSEIKLGVGFDI